MSRTCNFPVFDADIHLYETLFGSDFPHSEGLARIMRVGVTV